VLLRRSSDPKQALKHYASAAQLAPLDHRVHYNRGLALEELDQPAPAMESYGTCLKLKPDFVKAKERIEHLKKMVTRK
jgi:Flp pilus assembly protein TadD